MRILLFLATGAMPLIATASGYATWARQTYQHGAGHLTTQAELEQTIGPRAGQ
ncbi:MAG TPA: hypothetical protein VGG72_36510 [Bryobacteraceae bacterium]|jgi:hypothetical protein